MSNTLTNLIPTVVSGFDVVSREMVGFIPSVNRDPRADRVAKNQTLYSWQAPTASLSTITPANVSPQGADKVFGNVPITITNFKMTDWYFTGEEAYGLNGNYGPMVDDLVQQGIRSIVNQMETDIWTAASIGASRAYGTAGTTPFGAGALTSNVGNVGETAQMKKILDDNGAPLGTRSLIIDTTSGAALRTLANLTRANEAGTTMTLRDGELLNLNTFSIKESNAVTTLAIGTTTNANTNAGGYSIGATVITLNAAGTGTIVAGDVVTFGSDTNKYIVATGTANVNSNAITIAAPGLRKAISAANTNVVVVALGTRNMAFSRNALLLATRLPALPPGGDMAIDRQIITDPRSGMSLELALYQQYRQLRYELSAAWSATVIKPEHLAQLLG